ncbi:MAG TPA: hypothetical protein VFK38_07430 [Candidatus Limnocylindrales bacterium]|nr:hypothetical protein [Candidatus Limnocylindrales bacterium]
MTYEMPRRAAGLTAGVAGAAAVVLILALVVPSDAPLVDGHTNPGAIARDSGQNHTVQAANELDGHSVAVQRLIEAGYVCLHSVAGFYAAPTTEQRVRLQSLVALAGGTGHFLHPGGVWAPGQGWIGTFPEAVAAFGGRVVVESDHWIELERDGRPHFTELIPRAVDDATTVWVRSDFVEPAACGGR